MYLCLFLSEQLQRTYQEKYDALVERERNSIERLQKEQEVSDHSVIVGMIILYLHHGKGQVNRLYS